MRRASHELWYSLLAVILITLMYVLLAVSANATPASSSLFGHVLGVVGFIFMLMTEILYSLRKRNRRAARWGRMESWLQFHIFTGIVGPYMVLLHTAWRFQGLAGAVTLMMVVIVGSGFFGRYIYILVPRTAAGVELNGRNLEYYIETTEADLRSWVAENSTLIQAVPQDLVSLPQISRGVWSLIFGRIFVEWHFHWRWWWETRNVAQKELKQLKRLLNIRRQLHYQIASLMLARRILALWHTIHVPLGITLFTMAFIHIGVTIYYVTLAR